MMSRKTYDNPTFNANIRDEFARDCGIDVGEVRGGVFDDLHRIEVSRLEEERAILLTYCDEWKRLRNAARQRGDIWILIALLGWGMFAIACVTRFLK